MFKTKFYLKLLMGLLLTALYVPHAQAADVTICDGTTTNYYVPIDLYKINKSGTYGQMIFPLTTLGLSDGDVITSITFYGNQSFSNTANVTLRLGETTATAITSSTVTTNRTSAQEVFTGTIPSSSSSDNAVTFNFTSSYTYHGGNLIVDLYRNSGGSAGSTSFKWYGVSATSGASYVVGSKTGNESFLPKMLVTYEPATLDDYAAKVTPNSLNFGDVAVNSQNTLDIILKNTGANAFIPSFSFPNGYSTTYVPASIAAGETVTIPVVFNPTSTGDYNGILTIDCGNAGQKEVALTGSASQSVTIADGGATSAHLPVWGYNYDGAQTNQMIYPATMLNSLNGKKITGMTFYFTCDSYNKTIFYGGSVTFSLANTTVSEFSSRTRLTDGLVQVASIVPANGTENEWTITFDNNAEFVYSGGNLLLDVVTTAGTWANTTFSGESGHTGASWNSQNSSLLEFLPKVKFTYEDSDAPVTPTITVNPATLDAFSTVVGTPVTAAVAVTGSNLEGDISVSTSGESFSVNPTTLPSAGGTVTVTFNPTTAGSHTGTLTLSSAGAEDVVITLNGSAEAPVTSGTVTPASLTFETYAGVAKTLSISVENTGNTAFTPTFSGIAAPFSIAEASEIAVGQTKTFDVTYNRATVGSDNATLVVTIDGVATNVTLSGNAAEAPKEVTVADGTDQNSYLPINGWTYDYKQINQMIYPSTDLSAFNGKGITSMTFYSPQIKYSGGKYNVSVGLTDQSTFTTATRITGLTQVAADLVATATSGETELKITFSEPFTYEEGKNLVVEFEVTEAGSCDPSYSNLTYFYGKNQSANTSYNSYCTYGTNYNGTLRAFLPKTTFSYAESASTPVITVDPANVEAFSTEVGTPVSKTVTVTGENLTDAITTAISGTNADCFSTVLENGVLTITYDPTAAGEHTATLTLSSTGAEDVTIALSGSATAPAQPYAVTVNPDNGYDFGNVVVENSKVWTITVANNGTEQVTPTLSGIQAPFSTDYTATALAAGESVNIAITFAPTELEEYSNTVTLSFPEANGAIAAYTYELTGVGVNEAPEPSDDNEVVKLITVDKRSIYEPNFVDPNPEHNQSAQQLNCYDMRFRMAQPDDPAKQIKAGDLRPGNNLYEFYAMDDFGTEFRFATINLFAEGNPSTSTTTALDAPIKVTPSVEYYSEDGMPVHPTHTHYSTLNYTEKTYTNVNDTVDLYGVINYVNDTWSANTATNAHPDHYKFQIRGVGQFGELLTSLTAEYVEQNMGNYGLVEPEGWESGSYVGPNNEGSDGVHTFYYYDLYIKRSFFEEKGITGPVTVVVNTTLSGSGFNADSYKAMSVNGVEQIIAKEEFKDYSWTVPLGNELPENTIVEQVPMGVVIRLVSTGADFNRTTGIYVYGGTTGVSNVDTVNIYKSSMNVKAYTQKQVDDDTDRNLVAMKNGTTETGSADVNVLAYADPAVTGYTLYENSSASTTGMTQVATATHEANGKYSVESTDDDYTDTYDYVRDESLGSIDGMWLPMHPADPQKYFLPVTVANGVGDDNIVRSEGNTYGSGMQQIEKNGSIDCTSSKCYKSTYTWKKDGVTYAVYSPEVELSSELPAATGYQLYKYRMWVDYEDDAPAWDFDFDGEHIYLTDKMDRPLYDGLVTHIGGEGDKLRKDEWAFVAPADLTNVKLVLRCYYKKTSSSSNAPIHKARPTDSDRLYYVVETQKIIPTENIITGIDDVTSKTVANVKYYNVAGVESNVPFDGVNIEVTTYDDGTRSTRKVLK